MLVRRLTVALCAAALIITGIYLYNNILILDDSHSEPWDLIEASTNIVQNDQINSEDNSSNTTDKAGKISEQLAARKGYHIYINLDELMMYVLKDGKLLKTYPVSGGKATTPTPLGTWKIISKDTWGEGFGGAWLGFNVPWGKYGIHGTKYPWFIGKSNSSKGCIRMKNSDVKELYKLVPHGTIVTIEHKSPSFRALKSGAIGSDVIAVQKALKKLGYYHGGIDGKFGTALKNSIIKFQKDNKLYKDGVIGRRTYNLIMEKAGTQQENKQSDQ